METAQAQSRIDAEYARDCVQILLTDADFRVLHGRVGGEKLYRCFCSMAGANLSKARTITDRNHYATMLSLAKKLLDYESAIAPLSHPTDADAVTCRGEDGSLDILVG